MIQPSNGSPMAALSKWILPKPVASQTRMSRNGLIRQAVIPSQAPTAAKMRCEARLMAETRESRSIPGRMRSSGAPSNRAIFKSESPSAQASTEPTMPPPAMMRS